MDINSIIPSNNSRESLYREMRPMHERLAEQTASFSSIARKSLPSPSILDFEPAAEKLLKAYGFTRKSLASPSILDFEPASEKLLKALGSNSIDRNSLTSSSILGFETVAEKLATPSLFIPTAREILAPKSGFYSSLPEQIEGLKGIKEEISLASHIAKQLMPHQERVDEFRAAAIERLDVTPILEKLGIFWQAEDEEIDSFLESVSWTGPTAASTAYFDRHFEFNKQSHKNIAAKSSRDSDRTKFYFRVSIIVGVLIESLQAIQSELRCRADHHCELPPVPQIVEPAKAALVKPDQKNAAILKEIHSPWVKSTQSSLPAPKKAAPR